jgi:PAS domain S-box-containing protein
LDERGEIVEWLGAASDITTRKQAEEALRESEERMRLLVESVEDYAIFTVTPDNLINSWNPGGEQIFGYSEDEILGQSGAVLFTPEDRERGEHLKEINTALETGRAANERYHLRKDGSRFYASGVLAVLGEDAQKNGFVKICRDLTERRQMEETLRDADRRKDEFLATLAHELRNPLAPIRTGLEIMRRGEDKTQGQNAREIIERQTDQLVHLVDDLLDISRITQGKIKLRKQQVNIADSIKIALETVQPFAENLRHRMDVRLPDTPVFVEADSTRLTQIVLNLLHNSAKYTEPGGHILLIAAREGNEAVIRVRDNGVGIRFEMLPKIFDMFAQIESSEKRGQGGLGIGLSLVKKLVEMHGGTVEAHSEDEEKGSEFVVRLPLSANQKPKVVKQTIEKTEKTNDTNNAVKKRRILVVDDNADAASMLEVLLTMDSHKISTAFNGRDALEKAAEFAPDTAILDIGLPDIDGHKLAERLREQLPEIYLIALSGWGQTEDLRRSDEAGFNHHLVKPVDVEELKKLLS